MVAMELADKGGGGVRKVVACFFRECGMEFVHVHADDQLAKVPCADWRTRRRRLVLVVRC